MNRLTRITAILIQLQSKPVVTAKEMAERFDISLRTVYSDIKTLQDAGLPIGSENGIGYSIVEGYSLPPIMVTEEEANALIVSEQLILNQGDTSLKRDFNSLLIKIKAILKSREKQKISKLTERVSSSKQREVADSQWLSMIQKAITSSKVLQLTYHSMYKNEQTTREVEPLAVYYTDKAWILIAHCRLRDTIREFRVDRMLSLFDSYETFEDRHDFKLTNYFTSIAETS